MAIITQSVFTPLFFGQSIQTRPLRFRLSDIVPVTHDFTINQRRVWVASSLALTQSLHYTFPSKHYSVTQTLALKSKGVRVIQQRITNTLPLATKVLTGTNRSLSHLLFVVQGVHRWVLSRHSASHALSLSQTWTVVVNAPNPNACVLPIYNTFVTLSQSPLSITLPCPDYGNRVTLNNTKILTRSRGDQLLYYRDPRWSRERNTKLTFSTLIDTERAALALFLKQTYGQVISYTDFNNTTHSGIVTTANPEFVEVNNCTWQVELEFQDYDQ